MDFFSAYDQGFARVAAITVPVAIADPAANAERVIAEARRAHEEHVAVAVFPELGLSGYSIDDLFLQDTLLDGVRRAIDAIVSASVELLPVLVVGAPLARGNRVYNCAVVIHRGEVLGVAPKSYLPNYREFYERRWFAPGDDTHGEFIEVNDDEVPFGPDLVFRASDVEGLALHVEICEDMWVPIPPSSEAALAGATVLANLSGSPITVGRAEERRLLVRSASARCAAAYLYAAAGQGESTTDLSWDGQTMVYECGDLLAEGERFPATAVHTVADVDLDRLRQERLRQGSFDDNRRGAGVWAKTGDLNDSKSIRGFIVPTDTPGFSAKDQKGKLSLLASDTSELVLQDVRVPDSALLPKSGGLKSPLMCLTQARYGIAWGAIGAAMACYDEAVKYATNREMFGRPLGGTQIQQVRLADMLTEITKAQLLAWRLGNLKEAGAMRPEQVSLAKRNNVNIATEVAREARRLLGGNGILIEYQSMRHMANLESVYTYEGTHDVHGLILGQDITGIAAY